MLKATGASHIRWPGGNYANMLFWNNDYDVCPYFAKYADKNNDKWMWTWPEAAAYGQNNGVDVLWQMNAAVGMVCGPDVAASLAAAFIANATAAGFDIKYVEVGNENYGKWEVPYPDKPSVVSPSAYAAACNAVSAAIKAVKPTVLVGCVGDLVTPGHSNTPFLDWNKQVLAAAEDSMDFLIIHEYYNKIQNPSNLPTPWEMLNYGCLDANSSASPNCGPLAIAAAVKAAASKPLPVMITEYNMVQPYCAPTWQIVQVVMFYPSRKCPPFQCACVAYRVLVPLCVDSQTMMHFLCCYYCYCCY